MTRFRTELCALLGIEHPILQSGMRNVAGPELVAEVSRAGGLGILAGLMTPPDVLRQLIARVRELTDRPFGVNLWLHTAMQPPVDIGAIPEREVQAMQDALNRLRAELGVAAQPARAVAVPDLIDAAFEVILEERVPVFSIGLGDPGRERTARCHERGIRVVAMACTVEDARQLADSGVDVIVAQGGEAGGHRSTWVKPESPQAACIGTIALVPQVVDAVQVPVVAAGGIADGRGLCAALALGAQAVILGTRFVATRESLSPAFFKQAILESSSDATVVTDLFTGLHARAARNRLYQELSAAGVRALPPLVQAQSAQDVYASAAKQGKGDYFPMLMGQSHGLIHDLPSAGDVVRTIMEEAERALLGLQQNST